MRAKHAAIIRAGIIAARHFEDPAYIEQAQRYVMSATIKDMDLFMKAYYRTDKYRPDKYGIQENDSGESFTK